MPGMTALLLDHLADAARRIEAGDYAGDQATVDVHLDGAGAGRQLRRSRPAVTGLRRLSRLLRAGQRGRRRGEDIAALYKRIPAPPD